MNKQELANQMLVKSYQVMPIVDELREVLAQGVHDGAVNPTVARVNFEMFQNISEQITAIAKSMVKSLEVQ